MGADAAVKSDSMNSCCKVLKDKYTKLEEKRNALRQAVKLLEQQIDKIQAENINLKKACEEEKAQALTEKEGREKEAAARVSLEDQIAALKSEISSLQKKGVNSQDARGEMELLRGLVAEGKKEINQLTKLLGTEKKRADSEEKKAEVEKKKAAEAWKIVKAEKSSEADEARRSSNIDARKAKEYILQLEVLKKEANEAKSKLAGETLKLQAASKKLEAERQKATTLRERADREMSKAEEQHVIAEAYRKKAEEERIRAESLFEQLEESRRRVENLQKQIQELVPSRKTCEVVGGQHALEINLKENGMLQPKILKRVADESKFDLDLGNKKLEVEMSRPIMEKKHANSEMVIDKEQKFTEYNQGKAIEEKCGSDPRSCQLEENKWKVKELQKKTHEKLVEASASFNTFKGMENAKMRFLKKQLRFEKMKAKHAKEVAKLEKNRNIVLQQELGRVKLEFLQFSCRLDVLYKSFSSGAEGIYDLRKTENLENKQRFNLEKKQFIEPRQAWLPAFTQTQRRSSSMLPVSGGICAESISGTNSTLEPLIGGSDREMLQTSAINSSSASLSDGQLVGSQEKSAFSLTASAKLVKENLNSQPTISNLSSEVTMFKCNDNNVLAENGVRSTVSCDAVGKIKHCRKRKRMVDAVESIEYLHSLGKKLHLQIEEKLSVLRDNLHKKVDKLDKKTGCLLPVRGNTFADNSRSKKRKTSCKEKILMQHTYGDNEIKKKQNVDSEACEIVKVNNRAPKPGSNFLGCRLACSRGLNGPIISDLEALESFAKVANGEYMKLLHLDNVADEERYRRAMEMPLSPTLPDIEVLDIETFYMESCKPFVEGFTEKLSNQKVSQLHSRSIDVIDAEINANKLEFDCPSLFHDTKVCNNNKGLLHPFVDVRVNYMNCVCDTIDVGEMCIRGVQDIDTEANSGDEGAKSLLTKDLGSMHHSIPKNCIVFSNAKDYCSISRIYSATRTCVGRCCLITEKEWVAQKILLALKMEEKLLPKERACVIFSLLLLNFCTASFGKFGSFLNWKSGLCLNSFADHVHAVMSNLEIKSLFPELVCLDDLLFLIEDFLIDGRVLLYDDAYVGPLIENDTKINILLDGVNIILSPIPASPYQLIAGSIILASISAAVGRIGFLCEASYSILRTCKCDSSLMLAMLHVFAYLGGHEFFSIKNYSFVVTVLKSIVTSLEGGSSLSDDSAFTPPSRNPKIEFSQCAKCPFAENVVSVDLLTSFFLQLLQRNLSTGSVVDPINLLSVGALFEKYKSDKDSSHKEADISFDINCDTLCYLNKCKVLATQPDSVTNVSLCELSDVLSLVELLACYMSWHWTSITIIPPLLRMLESCVLDNFSAAIVILLGQLGRLGVDAGGYEDKGVENLKSKLSAFLHRGTAKKAGFSIQIATVSALLDLTSFDFKTIIQGTLPLTDYESRSIPFNLIKNWFSLFSQKQQDLSFSLFTSHRQKS